MKKLTTLLLGACLLADASMLAQEASPALQPVPAHPQPLPPPSRVIRQPRPPGAASAGAIDPTTGLETVEARTRFDLDFPGGTPRELAKAIETSRGKPLNLIVPIDAEAVQIPALKMTHVDLPDLFQALGTTSLRAESYVVERGGNQTIQQNATRYSIRAEGPITDDVVWSFIYENRTQPTPLPEKKICRFFNLAPFLNDPSRSLKIEAITTAIETGWKMLGETSIPTMKFHPDTKLLIAVGEPFRLEMIDMVLKEIGPGGPGLR